MIQRGSYERDGLRLSYLADGPQGAPVIVFVHGWPAAAVTWQPQLEAFAKAGFRTVAPDLRGYGESAAPAQPSAYAQSELVADMLALLEHLGRRSAVWVGHDWGCATVFALAAHHPAAVDAVTGLAVGYRTLDRGYRHMLGRVDRDTYPAESHPLAQFDYMAFYEAQPERATEVLDADVDASVRALFRSGDPTTAGVPGPTSGHTRAGGWFGGAERAPDVPLDRRVLDDDLHRAQSPTTRRPVSRSPCGNSATTSPR